MDLIASVALVREGGDLCNYLTPVSELSSYNCQKKHPYSHDVSCVKRKLIQPRQSIGMTYTTALSEFIESLQSLPIHFNFAMEEAAFYSPKACDATFLGALSS